ncbi:MAG: hypothetical protein RIS94_1593 [Pseudomonadota bacterium]
MGDRLPYASHLDPETLLTRDGMLVQVIRLDGIAFETADDEELDYRKQIRETLLRSIASSRIAVWHHMVRRRASMEIEGEIDEPFSRALDMAWREKLASRQLFFNEHYLTLVYRPLQGSIGLIDRLLRKAGEGGAGTLSQDLQRLHAIRDSFTSSLAHYCPRTLSVVTTPGGERSELASFVALLFGGDRRDIATGPGDVGHTIPDRRLTFGFDAMEFGPSGSGAAHYGAMLSLKDYPAFSSPGIFDGLSRLPCELLLTESFAFMDRQAGYGRMGLALRRLRAADDDAFSLREELALARDELGAGRTAYGEHHLTVLVRTPDYGELRTLVADVQASLTDVGGVAVREDMNLEPAFWAQFPGNFRYIARKAMVSVANFAGFASLHNHVVGQAHGNHWGPALTVLETTALSPYHFNFHNGDLGNFTVIGPSGAGKTVLLTFLLAQARKYRPRILYFDKDRGAEPFIRASGGSYHVLRPGASSGFNPLQLPDSPATRAFLADWLIQLLGGTERLDAEDLAIIADAIDANYGQEPRYRRLSYLRELFAGGRRPRAGDIADRLEKWCEHGDLGWMFDNAEDSLDLERETYGFDMTALLDAPVLRTPAMMYLFYRIEQDLDGRPTIIVVDEGWKALDDEVFTRRLKDWQKTIRKRNGVVGFCTQSASDALESRIAATIVEQSATQIFLPNPKASAADYIDGFGLSEHEFDLVRSLPDTSRCFLIKRADHSAVVRLDLSGLEDQLVVLAGTERSVRLLDRLRAELGDDPAFWLPAFRAQLAEARG